MKHIVMYSGGIGSWMTAKRVVEKYGKENTLLLFTDTLIEDEDLYRFLDETAKQLDVELVKIADGRTPFEIFQEVKFLGNSRIAHCSKILKQDTSREWIHANYKPDECILYLGIDWTEKHRVKAPREGWAPYTVKFPMCVEPYLSKDEMIFELNQCGIKTPRLYEMGFSHNNCGGFCCRAGQGHFANLLDKMPERFDHYEKLELETIDMIGKNVAMMTKQENGVKRPYTMKNLREDIQQNQEIDQYDIGGCGCFVTN